MAIVRANFQPRQKGGLLRGVNAIQGLTAQGLQNEVINQNDAIKQALSGVTAPQPSGLGSALQEDVAPSLEEMKRAALKINPFLAKKQFEALGIDTQAKRAEASRFASTLQNSPFQNRDALIKERAQMIASRGGDPKDTMTLLDMSESDQNKTLIGVQLADLSTKDRFGVEGARARGRQATQKSFAPITIINPITKEKRLVSPTVNNLTGEPSLNPFDLPEGFIVSEETTSEKREGEIDKILQLENLSEEKRQQLEIQKIKLQEARLRDRETSKQVKTSKATNFAEADNAINLITGLLKGDRFSGGFGRLAATAPDILLPSETVDIKAEIDQITNLIGLESRKKLKGQGTVSDSEALALAKSATLLANPLISDKAARKELKRVRGIFEASAERNRTKSENKKQVLIFNPETGRLE